MNTDTGALYMGEEAIAAATLRGEPIARVSEHIVRTMRAGQRAEAKARARATAKRRRKQARQDRKRNRR
jgi:hypothetical protein